MGWPSTKKWSSIAAVPRAFSALAISDNSTVASWWDQVPHALRMLPTPFTCQEGPSCQATGNESHEVVALPKAPPTDGGDWASPSLGPEVSGPFDCPPLAAIIIFNVWFVFSLSSSIAKVFVASSHHKFVCYFCLCILWKIKRLPSESGQNAQLSLENFHKL